jgi:hypothetical protein
MATTTTDPFAGKRGDPSHTPVNSLDSDQLDELKLEIRNMYKTTFNIGLPSSKKPETITGQVKDALIKNLEVALAMSPHFQKAVTEEFVTPYIHNFSALSIDEGWLLGLYLPGFYEQGRRERDRQTRRSEDGESFVSTHKLDCIIFHTNTE